MGGGTGLATLLRGLKRYVKASEGAVEITAVVTVTDDGGSSGRLRRDFDVLPPGDIRNCMVALSQDEALLSRLFNYRFTGGRGLKGHSFGNLFLMAMTHLTGDFALGPVTAGVTAYNTLVPTAVVPRSHSEVSALLSGLPLVPPGVVPLTEWRPTIAGSCWASADMYAGLARAPGDGHDHPPHPAVTRSLRSS